MSATNNVSLIGRLTADPTLDGVGDHKMTKIRVAVDRYKDKTDFLPCTAWGATAEFITKYFHKGDPIAVIGELYADTVERDGVSRTFYDIHVNNVSFVPGSRNTDSGSSQQRTAPRERQRTESPAETVYDDSPF